MRSIWVEYSGPTHAGFVGLSVLVCVLLPSSLYARVPNVHYLIIVNYTHLTQYRRICVMKSTEQDMYYELNQGMLN